MKIRTRLLREHSKGCFGIKRADPWCLLGEKFEGRGGRYWGDKSGRRRGYTQWLVALCLNTQCYAEMAFCETDLLNAATGVNSNDVKRSIQRAVGMTASGLECMSFIPSVNGN